MRDLKEIVKEFIKTLDKFEKDVFEDKIWQ